VDRSTIQVLLSKLWLNCDGSAEIFNCSCQLAGFHPAMGTCPPVVRVFRGNVDRQIERLQCGHQVAEFVQQHTANLGWHQVGWGQTDCLTRQRISG
jgi:hypothetical protein